MDINLVLLFCLSVAVIFFDFVNNCSGSIRDISSEGIFKFTILYFFEKSTIVCASFAKAYSRFTIPS